MGNWLSMTPKSGPQPPAERDDSTNAFAICSDCFNDQDLKLDAECIGIEDGSPCPQCKRTSGFWYDRYGVARFPALGINYTTKNQYIFRINKGSLDVWDHDKINKYVAPDARPVPFSNMIFIGDGETDIPCFRVVKEQGGHSIAVYKPSAKKKGKSDAKKLIMQGRVNFATPADYRVGSALDCAVKSIIKKIAADAELKRIKGKLRRGRARHRRLAEPQMKDSNLQPARHS
jgi:hypothetical protein